MKRYVVQLLAFALALLLPFAAGFSYVQSLPPQFEGGIMGTIHHKVDLLEQTEGPRLILAGGSSSPYAADCAYLADELGVACINVGGTAYHGIDFYLSMLRRYMRPGDVIVIAPEHSMLQGSVSYETVWMSAENDPRVLKLVPAGYWPSMVTSYWGYAEQKRELARQTAGQELAAYHPDYGPLGDVVQPREAILEQGYNTEDPIALGPETLARDSVRSLNRFYEQARRQGVKVYFAFAPVDVLALTTPVEDWQALDEEVRRQVRMPVLGSQRESIMEAAYFYDSNNHLNTKGAALYSRRLAQHLEQAGAFAV